MPTPEYKHPALNSIYALNKYNQERMCLIIGKAYDIPTVALRFFNVYGPRQALSNPYTGVLAIFASRLLNGRQPLVFEDGQQRRDFVHVRDVAEACLLAMQTKAGIGGAYNIASGESRTIFSVAEDLARVMGRPEIKPCVTGKYRAGDIRHCFADVTRSRAELGFEPKGALPGRFGGARKMACRAERHRPLGSGNHRTRQQGTCRMNSHFDAPRSMVER